jgi:mannose-1-phosphate guanylyltransferase/mannose-6-phosphate isomerase
MLTVTPVILCGGSGSRLWPLSRSGFPKQFLSLTGKSTLFQQAAQRLATLETSITKVSPHIIVTGEEHRFLASEQLREVGIEFECALLEPEGRNTAPALTLAALAAMNNDANTVLVVTPADHNVANTSTFVSVLQQAVLEASKGTIVILGITPTHPETGYGYIKTNSLLQVEKDSIQLVQRFIEKPDALKAQQYLKDGSYFWNAGVFVLKASVFLEAM